MHGGNLYPIIHNNPQLHTAHETAGRLFSLMDEEDSTFHDREYPAGLILNTGKTNRFGNEDEDEDLRIKVEPMMSYR